MSRGSQPALTRKGLAAYFDRGTNNLAAAGLAAGVRLQVVLSVVGVPDVPMSWGFPSNGALSNGYERPFSHYT
ncbi:MAG: hypothetical protein K0U64_07995 [Actinomycetia bacterium]|nr:hypothetical protein [Actinomycetes bacterium]